MNAVSVPAGPPPRRKVAQRREISLSGRVIGAFLGIALLIGLWQLLSDTHAINPYIWSSPSAVWTAFIGLINHGELGPDCWESLQVFLWGYGIAIASGVLIGILTGWYRRAGALLDPWVAMLYAAPRVGIVPIIVAIAGLAEKSQIIVVWISAVFPIIINVAVGVDSVNRDYLRTAQSFLATNRDVLVGIAIPGSLPLLFAGLRQALVAALIGLVIAEYVLGNGGVGGLIVTASGAGQTAEAFVGALIFSIFAVAGTAFLHWLERRVSRWR